MYKASRIAFAVFAAVYLSIFTSLALASRNAAGTMSAANGPYIGHTTINVTQVNSRFSDVESEITDSLSRSGKGGMLAALRGVDGAVSAPAYSFTSEVGSGLYRIGANDLGWTIGGAKKLELTASLFTVTPNATLSGVLGVGGALPTTSTGTPFTATGAGPLFSVESRSGVNTRLGANTYYDGATDKYNATGFAGMLQIGGLTSADWSFFTAPSGTGGTLATFTERMKINESGVTIGASGTAISASIRGTTVWNPASTTNGQATTTITVTGAAAGADCVVTPPSSISTPFSIATFCYVTLNTCNIGFWSIGTNDLPSDTWACRVFNP